MSEKSILLEVKKLRKYYPKKSRTLFQPKEYVKSIDGLSFQIYEGETLGIVGESGCGKSTLGRQLVGLEEPTEGEILYRGEPFLGNSFQKKYRTKIQMVFQNTFSSLNPRQRIHEAFYAPLHFHNIVKEELIESEIDRLLEMVGLPKEMKQRYIHELSGGQRQRIGIARALSVKPDFLVLDEPVSALDPSVSAAILNLLKQLQKDLQLTCVFIGHGLSAVRYGSDRIAVMYLGKIVELAPTDELFLNPIHPYTKALFDAAPSTDITKRNQNKVVLSGEAVTPASEEISGGCLFFHRCPNAVTSCKEVSMELVACETMEKNTTPYDTHYCACPVMMKEKKTSATKPDKEEFNA